MMDTESHLSVGQKRMSFVGTHEYVAPEIIAEEGYVGSVDWWAFGILIYEMVYGTTPFRGSTQVQTLENILDITEDIEFPEQVPTSEIFKDLIRKLLAKVNQILPEIIALFNVHHSDVNFCLMSAECQEKATESD